MLIYDAHLKKGFNYRKGSEIKMSAKSIQIKQIQCIESKETSMQYAMQDINNDVL